MQPDIDAPRPIRFGVFELDLRAGELRKQGLKLRLAGQPFDVLAMLLERPGEIVTRDEIQKKLWPADTFVDFDHSLNTAVNKIREALGDEANNPRFVETVPRRGYRFIYPVETPRRGVSTPGPQSVAAIYDRRKETAFAERRYSARSVGLATSGAVVAIAVVLLSLNIAGLRDRVLRAAGAVREPPLQIHSIAVLPLENLSGDPEQEYFSDGMTDELITRLAQIRALRVISRGSVMQYKAKPKPTAEIARELNVDAVVEGTVLRSGGRVRISAQLIQASPEEHLWAESYERDLRDVLALQKEVAEAIAKKIQVNVTPQERESLQSARTVKPAAHDAYLRGRYFFDRRDPADAPRSTQYFRQAIDLDPAYAAAYAGLSLSLASQSFLEVAHPDEVMPQARDAARRALQLDPELGEAYTALGAVEFIYDWDWKSGERDLRRGIELNPGDPLGEIFYSWYLNCTGRPREAVAHMQRAVQLDPVSFWANRNLAATLYYARHYDAALAQLERTRELQVNPSAVDSWVSWIYQAKGMYDGAFHAELQGLAGSREPAANLDVYRTAYARSGWRGYLQARIERQLPRANETCVPYGLTASYLHIGNSGEALRWLNRAVDNHCFWVTLMGVDPQLDPIRSDPRYQDLLRRMNFPP